MFFPATLFAALFYISIGACGGRILCRIYDSAVHNRKRNCFSFICIMLSIAIASATATVVVSGIRVFEFFNAPALLWGGVLFTAAALCMLCWKIILPLYILLYAAVSVLLYSQLSSRYGKQTESINITVNAVSAQTDIEVTELLPEMLFPVRREWCSVVLPGQISALSSVPSFYHIFSHTRTMHLPVPEENITPRVYQLNFYQNGKFSPEYRRIL